MHLKVADSDATSRHAGPQIECGDPVVLKIHSHPSPGLVAAIACLLAVPADLLAPLSVKCSHFARTVAEA